VTYHTLFLSFSQSSRHLPTLSVLILWGFVLLVKMLNRTKNQCLWDPAGIDPLGDNCVIFWLLISQLQCSQCTSC